MNIDQFATPKNILKEIAGAPQKAILLAPKLRNPSLQTISGYTPRTNI